MKDLPTSEILLLPSSRMAEFEDDEMDEILASVPENSGTIVNPSNSEATSTEGTGGETEPVPTSSKGSSKGISILVNPRQVTDLATATYPV